jgi:excisionase family DNA binding protein
MPYAHVRPVPVVALSPSKAAASTGLRPERIASAIRSGELRAVRIGTKTRVSISELGRWVDSHTPATREVSHV